jgi:hypothetical protein
MNGRLIHLGRLGCILPAPDRLWASGPLLTLRPRKAPLGLSPRWFISRRGWVIALRCRFGTNAVPRMVPCFRKVRFQARPICK